MTHIKKFIIMTLLIGTVSIAQAAIIIVVPLCGPDVFFDCQPNGIYVNHHHRHHEFRHDGYARGHEGFRGRR